MLERDVAKLMREYRERVKKIALIKENLMYLEKIVEIKTTRYSDDVTSTKKRSLDDKYIQLLEEKDITMIALLEEERKVATVNKVLELLHESHSLEHRCLMMKYMKGKSYKSIAREIGYSEAGIKKKINNAKLEFSKIYNLYPKSS